MLPSGQGVRKPNYRPHVLEVTQRYSGKTPEKLVNGVTL